MTTAIILAAGRGTRMGTDTPKQFLEINGTPVIAFSLRVFENCPFIDEILLVSSGDYIGYCREKIISQYGFSKVKDIIEGGSERYDSVWNALLACNPGTDYVLIHDGARPCITEDVLERTYEAAKLYGAAAAAVPSKDTVKIADENGFSADTPPRNRVWLMQTPQAFSYKLIRQANEMLMSENRMDGVTDDAMIVERSGLAKVKLVEGSYGNIKITTPEDLERLRGAEWQQ